MNTFEGEFEEVKKQIKTKLDEASKLLNEITSLAYNTKIDNYYDIGGEVENIGSSIDIIEDLVDGRSAPWNNSGCSWESSDCYGE